MWICKQCNTENDDSDPFCIECGSKMLSVPESSSNHCSNPSCAAYNVMLPNPTQKHCGKCGSSTTFWEKVERQC